MIRANPMWSPKDVIILFCGPDTNFPLIKTHQAIATLIS